MIKRNKVGTDSNPRVARTIDTRPILDRIVVEYEKQDRITEAGIILGDIPRHEHPDKTGIVLAAGPGAYDSKGNRIQMTVKEGDTIMFTGTSGVSVGERRLLITENDVLVIL